MSDILETIVVLRDGNETVINKTDKQKTDKEVKPKKPEVKTEKKGDK